MTLTKIDKCAGFSCVFFLMWLTILLSIICSLRCENPDKYSKRCFVKNNECCYNLMLFKKSNPDIENGKYICSKNELIRSCDDANLVMFLSILHMMFFIVTMSGFLTLAVLIGIWIYRKFRETETTIETNTNTNYQTTNPV